ncbi:hypothetical protein GJ496_000636 [Pomphorhynchus laevis]|nr:hypothetical protein GJ496_000636 [Pomphorhynchus laevis]
MYDDLVIIVAIGGKVLQHLNFSEEKMTMFGMSASKKSTRFGRQRKAIDNLVSTQYTKTSELHKNMQKYQYYLQLHFHEYIIFKQQNLSFT